MSEELEKQKIELEENSEPKSLQIKDQDTYKFYDYMKSHPGPFVALLPIVFAAVSCVFQYIIYLHERYRAQFWNIPVKNIEINSFGVYSIAIFVISMILSSFIGLCSAESFIAYFSRIKFLMLIDELEKSSKNNDSIKYQAKVLELKNKYKNVSTEHLGELCFKILKILIYYLVLQFVLRIVYNNVLKLDYHIIINMTAFFLSIILAYFLFLSIAKKDVKIKHKLLIEYLQEEDKVDIILNSMNNIKMYPSESIAIQGWRALFSDSKIRFFVCVAVIQVLLYLLILKITFSFSPEKLYKTFPIVTENDKIYAVVYQTKDIYVLESATINNNEITIDTTQQRIIKTSDFAYEVKEFSSVKRLKLDAQNEENDVSADSSTNVQDTLIEQNPPVSDLANDTTQDTINGIDDDLEKSNDNDDDSDTETETANDIDDLEKSNDNDDDSDTVSETTNNTIKNEQGIDLKNDQ